MLEEPLILTLVAVFVIALIAAFVLMAFSESTRNRIDGLSEQTRLLRASLQSVDVRLRAIEATTKTSDSPESTPSSAASSNDGTQEPPAIPSGMAPNLAAAIHEIAAFENHSETSSNQDKGLWSPEALRHFEQQAGQRWMTWIGAIAVAVGMMFLIKYAFEHGWIGPWVRLLGGLAVGAGLIFAGEWANSRKYAALAQGLMGSGLAICQASLFAAYRYHDLLSQPATFTGMVLVTAIGILLAVAHDFLAFAILALIGALLTPILLSTGQDGRDTLFSYVLLLNLSVLGILTFRGWRWLDSVALLGTVALYSDWFATFYTSAAMIPALAWLFTFAGVFVAIPVLSHWRLGGDVPADRFFVLVSNTLFVLIGAENILWREHLSSIAFIAWTMALLYAVIAWSESRFGRGDRRFIVALTALAVTLLTLGIPIYFELDTVTLAWTAEAILLLVVGYIYRYRELRLLAAAVLVITLIRYLDAIVMLTGDHELPFFHRAFLVTLIGPLGALVFAGVHARNRATNDSWDSFLGSASGIVGGLTLLGTIWYEMAQWLLRQGEVVHLVSDYWYYLRTFTVLYWALGGSLFMMFGVWRHAPAARKTAVSLVVINAIIAAVSLSGPFPEEATPIFNGRFLAVAVEVAVLLVSASMLSRIASTMASKERQAIPLLLVTALSLSWWLGTVESYSYFTFAWPGDGGRRMALSAVSAFWASYAMVLLILGFTRRQRWLRLTGLSLFGLTALKLVVVDLSELRDLTRVFAFLAIGGVMIAASYLYHRLEQRLDPRIFGG